MDNNRIKLAMNAGARAIEQNKRISGSVYVFDIFGENMKEISYKEAAEILRRSDVELVEHGHWKETDAYPHRVYCSKCFITFVSNLDWLMSNGGPIRNAERCPHCGAYMDEEVRT